LNTNQIKGWDRQIGALRSNIGEIEDMSEP